MVGKRTGPAHRPLEARRCQHCGEHLKIRIGEAGRKRFCDEACRSAFRREQARVSAEAKSVTVRDSETAAVPVATAAVPEAGAPSESSQHVRFSPDSDRDLQRTWDASSQVNARFSADGAPPSSRYYAKFAAAITAKAGPERRFVTQRLRAVLRDVTTKERCKRCGREIVGTEAALVMQGEVAHVSGVETCGRIWLCPVCSAKIRVRRGEEVAVGVGDWIKRGGSCYFVTATLPHEHGDALADSLKALAEAWRWATSLRAAKDDVKRFNVIGNIKSIEVTHGRNGWHPHIHAVILTEEGVPLVDPTGHGRDMRNWYVGLDGRWARALNRVGWATGLEGVRLRLDMVERSTVAGLAAYVCKLQNGRGRGLGNEIARADLKGGRKTSRTPFEILADFGTTGEVRDLELWHEFETATQGRSAIRWSRGLRDLLLPDMEEQSDEEVAAEEVGGDVVAYIRPELWYKIADIPGADALVLDALESGGLEAVIRTLVALRLDPAGLIPADPA